MTWGITAHRMGRPVRSLPLPMPKSSSTPVLSLPVEVGLMVPGYSNRWLCGSCLWPGEENEEKGREERASKNWRWGWKCFNSLIHGWYTWNLWKLIHWNFGLEIIQFVLFFSWVLSVRFRSNPLDSIRYGDLVERQYEYDTPHKGLCRRNIKLRDLLFKPIWQMTSISASSKT